MLQIIPIPAFTDNYIWLIYDSHKPYAVVVDPGDAKPVIQYLEQHALQLSAILITHHHGDHTHGITALAHKYHSRVIGPKHEHITGVTEFVEENDRVTIAELDLQLSVFDIPGHTSGHIAFYNDELLFAGDTLFTAGCGRLFEGTAAQLFNSLQKLMHLPEHTLLYCGHEYTEKNLKFALTVEPHNSAIAQRLENTVKLRQQNHATVPASLSLEKQTNPFLRTHIAEIRQKISERFNTKPTDAVTYFELLRRWKDDF